VLREIGAGGAYSSAPVVSEHVHDYRSLKISIPSRHSRRMVLTVVPQPGELRERRHLTYRAASTLAFAHVADCTAHRHVGIGVRGMEAPCD